MRHPRFLIAAASLLALAACHDVPPPTAADPADAAAPRAGIYQEGGRWPGGVVFYDYDETAFGDGGARIEKAAGNVNEHTAKTGVRMVRDAAMPHVRIVPTTGRSRVSGIGFDGNDVLYLNDGSPWQTVVHELGHEMGMIHEHQRCDRDDYIIVDPAWVGDPNFAKLCDVPQPADPGYDTQSIMHYSFTEYGPGVHLFDVREGVPPPLAASLRDGLADSDVRTLALMYADDAAFVGWDSVPPATLAPGQSFTARVIFENRGSTTWTEAGGFRVGAVGDDATWGSARVVLPGDIAPGEWAYVTLKLRAPATPGAYRFQWRMVHDGVRWFGAASPERTIQVGAAPTSRGVALVSLMHGKCLDAAGMGDGTRVRMWPCQGVAAQRWSLDPASGEARVGAGKCLDAGNAQRLSYVVVSACTGAAAQKWDLLADGRLRLRGIVDELGRPMCLDVAHQIRTDGAQEVIQRCHRGDNQLFRKSGGTGGSVVGIFTDLPGGACLEAPASANGTRIELRACAGVSYPNQRFTRTAESELRVLGKCVEAAGSDDFSAVALADCSGVPGQKWDLSADGELKGLGGVCLDVPYNVTDPGTKLIMYQCVPGSPGQQWTYREPTG